MEKKIVSAITILLFVCHLQGQTLQDLNNAVQLSSDFDQNLGRLTFTADNRDFCEYSLYISFVNVQGFSEMPMEIYLVVGKGERQILNYKVTEGATQISYNYKYAMFRGSIYDRLNIDFNYSLPVQNGNTILATLTENQDGYQLMFELPSDTIYACRGGIVCNDELKDFTSKGHNGFSNSRFFSQITLKHDDGSFGEYVFKGRALVTPGENVIIGSPIAIVESNLDKYTVRFSAYFLDKNKLRDSKIGNKHTHFRPFFQTKSSGKIRLEDGKTYICEQTEDMMMQDMTKRQKRLYLKMKAHNTDEKN